MKRLLLGAALALTLAGCGAREALQRPEGAAVPATPYGAKPDSNPADQLTATAQARPARSDDLLQATDKRRDDEFDLPPPN